MSKTKNQKNRITKWIAGLLLFVMVFTMLTPVNTVKAASKMTVYVGEEIQYSIYGATITSVSSSNKKVVKVSKSKDLSFAFIMKAKKAGSATVTVKYKGTIGNKVYSKKLKITVKKRDLKAAIKPLDSNYVLLEVKNNTGQTFDIVLVQYTLKNSAGEIVEQSQERVRYVASGKTAYSSLFVKSDLNVDASKCEAKVIATQRDLDAKYKNVSGKDVVVTQTDVQESESSINFNLKVQNKLNKSVSGVIYIISYDAQGNIIDLNSRTLSLNKKETKTLSSCYVSKSAYSHPNYDHYKLVTQLYTSERKK